MASLEERAAGIRLVVFDIDGVFTDGRLSFGADGSEVKTFFVRDGYGVKALRSAGIEVAVISGRRSETVSRRMRELGVAHVFQGDDDKLPIYSALIDKLGLAREQVAYVGDDVPDLPVLRQAGLPIAVADAHPDLQHAVAWTTPSRGGRGAVRDVCDLLLQARAGATR
ncbi:MAG: 3-deoxy-manno-octulosonate-8-phosphatase KdsC [Gammaproteobacteria bacterium]|nr:3-deoxy-manno-octulosonate-8-phosphatase KdsC [Gammaproteobacteria bacterium]